MKKWIIRLVIAAVVLVVIVLAVLFFSLNGIVKRGVEYVGPQIVKVDVKLDAAAISPFSGSGRLIKLSVGNPPGYNSPTSIKVGDIKVVVESGSVMSETIKIDTINIQAPEITCEGSLLSGFNLKDIEKNLSSSDTSSTATSPSGKPGKKFAVKDIVIEGGKINLIIKELGGKNMTVPLPPIHLQNVGTDTAGVTAKELAQQIVQPLLASAIKTAVESAGNLGGAMEGLGKGATEQLKNAGGGLKGLFGH